MRRIPIALLAMLAAGCSALLPHSESRVVSQWANYDEASQSFGRIEPYKTRESDLEDLGFSPHGQPNVRMLNYADIAEHFSPVALDRSELPAGLRECFERNSECYGYRYERRVTKDKRYGSFLADFFNFRRKTETKGWAFDALIVLIDGQVVYKLWSGTPEIHEYQDKTNPLGPLQGIGPSLTPRPNL